tara:strand:+ start:3456 stop:4211 length:756 start_codon:yes stop_codon:yes gene_type:complete
MSKTLSAFKHLLYLSLVLFLSACCKDCDEREYKCEGLSEAGIALLPRSQDQYVFTDGADSTLTIDYKGTFIGKTTIENCYTDMFGFCRCEEDYCVQNRGRISFEIPNFYRLDSTVFTYDSGSYIGNNILVTKDSTVYSPFPKHYGRYTTFVYDQKEGNAKTMEVSYNSSKVRFVLSNPSDFNSISNLESDDQVNLLTQFITGENQYTNVIEVIRNVNEHYHSYPSKYYYDVQFGLIAFEDEEGTLFYQKKI